jgi:hypothetical protein
MSGADLDILPERRVSERFCEMLKPSPDNPFDPQPNDQGPDNRPLRRASHVFLLKDEGTGVETARLTGPLEEHWPTIWTANRLNRVGVWLPLHNAILAAFHGELRVEFPLEPSLAITGNCSPPPDAQLLTECVWLHDGKLTAPQLDLIAVRLKIHGVPSVITGDIVVRLPGTYNRAGKSIAVSGRGTFESQGQHAPRYSASELAQAFALAAVE